LEEDVCPGIDEEANPGGIRRLPGVSDAIDLIDGLDESE